MIKISDFIIGLILIGAIITGVSLFIANAATEYGTPYDNATFAAYDQFESLQAQSTEINRTMASMSQGGITDYVGGLLKGGYQVLKVTWGSFDTFSTMSADANNKIQSAVPGSSYTLKALGLIAFIAFIFILVSAIVGRDV